MRTGPPLHDNEFALTETVLGHLRRAGMDDDRAALAYHALIELTVGSAALDAPMAALDDAERRRRYRAWRTTYASLDETLFPVSVSIAPALYQGTATPASSSRSTRCSPV